MTADVAAPARVGVGEATRQYRRQLMLELMDREQLDALAFTSMEYVQFATNFGLDVSGFERPGICIVPRDGHPFLVLNELSSNKWRFQSEAGRLWAPDAFFYSEHPRVRSRLPLVTQWNELVAAMLEQRGLARATIGSDGGGLEGVSRVLPHLRFGDVEAHARRLRLVKHPEEIEVMRRAASLSDWGQERYREEIRPGRLVSELDMTVAGQMAAEAARRMPGTDLEIFCWTVSGPMSAAPHGVSSGFGNIAGATVEAGHGLVTCVCPAIDGLFIENERTWFCGNPSSRQAQLFEIARAATEAACEAAVVGRPVWAIDAAAQDVFEQAGTADLICHRTGHGLGLGGHDFPVDIAFNSNPLAERMVFSVEPGLYEFGVGGFRHDDTVVVGDEPEILTTTSKNLAEQTIA